MEHRELRSIPPFRPRATTDDGDGEAPLRLGTNENPLGPSPQAVEAVRAAATSMQWYPATPHAALDDALAARWDVTTDQVWLGAGAVGVINTLTRAMVDPGESVLRPDPGFGYFGRSNLLHYGDDTTYPIDRSDDFSLRPSTLLEAYDGQPIIYLNTPHNPSGATISLSEIRTVVDRTDDDTLIVVDEAYGLFSETPSAVELVDETERVAVLRTFSKAHGLAGVRIGYGIVPTSIASAYERVATPFGVGGLACVAARAALDDAAYLERSVAVAREGRQYLHEAIDAKTWPSEGNFVLVEAGDGSAVTKALAEEGILVKDCTGFGLEDCIRITVGTPEQNRVVVDAVNRVID